MPLTVGNGKICHIELPATDIGRPARVRPSSPRVFAVHHNATLPDVTCFGPKIVAINASDVAFRS